MRRILFVKKSGRLSGGHIKFRDYFDHCLHHPELDPYAYLAFDLASGGGALWDDQRERILSELDVEPFDLLFVDGSDCNLLPPEATRKTVIHLIQDFRHTYANDRRFEHLARPGLRICVSDELAAAVRPHAAWCVAAIPNGIPPELFAPDQKERGSVVIWARKDTDMGKILRSALKERGFNITLLTRPVPRDAFAKLLGRTDLFVGLPKGADRGWEGFFLPALEAMASGCVVVCADAIGNRSFCIDGQTCRVPAFGDTDSHVRVIEELMADEVQAERLRAGGRSASEAYTLARERDEFYLLVEEHALVKGPARL